MGFPYVENFCSELNLKNLQILFGKGITECETFIKIKTV